MNKRSERLPAFEKRLTELKGAMSQGEFANLLGISRQTMGFYLNGDRLPSALFIRRLFRLFKLEGRRALDAHFNKKPFRFFCEKLFYFFLYPVFYSSLMISD